ncbi:MAG: flippase-like domain-containing protein [Flavobacteriales bacterium]|nr:flippase-like domain-containing protein [Flavobacteriales bacterium]
MSAKVKYYFFNAAKIAIAIIALYFIYEKISDQPLEEINKELDVIESFKYFAFVPIFLFSSANWFFEILKWQNLSFHIRKINLSESFAIVLSSFTASIITPNKIGEYGAKVMFYDKARWKKVLGYNFIGNMMQLSITLLMAIVFYHFTPLIVQNKVPEFIFSVTVIIFFVMTFFLFNMGLSLRITKINKRIDFKSLSEFTISDRFKVLLLSLMRYLSFSFQFLFILFLFGIEISLENFSIITLNYLLISVVPTIFLGDLLIRGSIAIFMFSLVGINELVVVSVVFIAWIFNFVLPAVIGAIMVLKPKTQ